MSTVAVNYYCVRVKVKEQHSTMIINLAARY